MRIIPKPFKISDVGLEHYLEITRSLHNNFGYPEFISMLENGVDKSNLAKAFGVSRNTIYSWLKELAKEAA